MIRLWLYKLRNFDRAITRYVEMGRQAQQNQAALEHWQQFALGEARNTHAILVAWRLSMDAPELDVHEQVDAMIEEYQDQLARLTEQIVV